MKNAICAVSKACLHSRVLSLMPIRMTHRPEVVIRVVTILFSKRTKAISKFIEVDVVPDQEHR